MLRKIDSDYDLRDRAAVYEYLERHQQAGEIVTGMLYCDDSLEEMHDISQVCKEPLSTVAHSELCPGDDALQVLQNGYR